MEDILFVKRIIMENKHLFEFELTEKDVDDTLTEYLVEQTIAKAIDYCTSENFSGDEFKYHKEGFIIGYIGEHINIRKKALEENDEDFLNILDNIYK